MCVWGGGDLYFPLAISDLKNASLSNKRKERGCCVSVYWGGGGGG